MEYPSDKSHSGVSRRRFMRAALCASGAALFSDVFPENARVKRHEARYYKKLAGDKVQCLLCPWCCVVLPGARGQCNVRENVRGGYQTLVYGTASACHIDPIEKKPFFHFLPGQAAYSLATAGCNLECKFCQNWELARRSPEEVFRYGQTLPPGEAVRQAAGQGCPIIAFTYNEPVISLEYTIDIATLAREKGIRNVVVSNGFIRKEPLQDVCKVIDAYKVDLKGFTESYYEQIVGGSLAPVLDTLVFLKERGIWTEIVYLVVPTYNDGETEIRNMVEWVGKHLGPDVPVHFSRFYPQYKLKNLPPTPVSTLEKARRIGLEAGLHYVYLGNVPGHAGESTTCPACGRLVITRTGYSILENRLKSGKCGYCGNPVSGVWSAA
jgi:pyruvate formate lyase activating enzyme